MAPVSPPSLGVGCEPAADPPWTLGGFPACPPRVHRCGGDDHRHDLHPHPPERSRPAAAPPPPAPRVDLGTAAASVADDATATAAIAGTWTVDTSVGEFSDADSTATFVLTEPVELGAGAASGTSVTGDATGDLTVHGITRQVTIPLQAQLVDGTIVIVGSTEITFADYGVSVPEAPIVLSAEDTGTLELQLFLQSS
jgi:polyisoprenoid-binding protein YceI